MDLALNLPIDTNLRPRSLQEILQADRAVWASIFELTSDHGWSLPDALNEMAFCRGEMANPLQPRPRPPRTPPPPSGEPKGAARALGANGCMRTPRLPKQQPKRRWPRAKPKPPRIRLPSGGTRLGAGPSCVGDLRHFLQVKDEATWESLLTVQDGQPFRLNLWHCLAESLALFDPRLPWPGLRLFPTTS